jgi:hypothetical protein
MLEEVKVQVKDIDLVWHVVQPMLQPAIDLNEGDFDADHVYENLHKETMQLFLGYNTEDIIYAAITEICPYQHNRALRIVLMGGTNINSWVDTDIFENFGKLQGCNRIEIVGRKGWIKKLQSRGYKQTHFIVTKEL